MSHTGYGIESTQDVCAEWVDGHKRVEDWMGDAQMDRWTETKQKTHYRTTETQCTQHVLPLRASRL